MRLHHVQFSIPAGGPRRMLVREDDRAVSLAERDTFPGYLRFHVKDPFGNRVEVLTRAGTT